MDGSLLDCSLSIEWADCRETSKEDKAHIGFDPQCFIPIGFVLADGKSDEKDQVETLLPPHHTGILDRYYQCHADLDRWSSHGRFYVCRIKENTIRYVLKENLVPLGSSIQSDTWVILGSSDGTYTHTPVRLVTFRAKRKVYSIATNRFDLTAQEIADISLLRWSIEIFFGWWKRHLRVYHLIARSRYGLTVQLLAGLITYLLLAIYCHEQFGEKVSITRVRQLQIQNDSTCLILIPFFLLRYAIS